MARKPTSIARGSRGQDPWEDATAHLRQADARMHALIERVGPCQLRPQKDRFGMLVRSIVSQQISTRAAKSINERLHALSGSVYTPEALLALSEDTIRSAGVSRTKAQYILNLAEAVGSGAVPLAKFGRWSDEAIIESLTTIKGIGVWTAEMFLMFALNRPDVLPVGDLGIRSGLRDWHSLVEMPAPRDCHALAEHWRPFRTVACWYLWRSRDTGVAKEAPPA